MMLDRELLENMDTALKSVLADYNDTQLAQAGYTKLELSNRSSWHNSTLFTRF